MAQRAERIYVFSVANVDFGRIVASIDHSGKRVYGENIFELLDFSAEKAEEIREIISGYGKRPFATVCGRIKPRAIFFFKHFTFCTSLCLAILPAIRAKSVADILSCGVFEDVTVSDSLSSLASASSRESVVINDMDAYMHLARIFGQIMDLLGLKFQYASDLIPTIRPAAEGIAELLHIELEFHTRFETHDDLVAVDEIFDGRFCAAAMLVCFIVASKRSSTHSVIVSEVRGFGGVRVEISFPCRRHTGLDAIYRMKKLAELNHGIRFDIFEKSESVEVNFVPLYQDVGFVGVKNGDEIFDIAAYTEMF